MGDEGGGDGGGGAGVEVVALADGGDDESALWYGSGWVREERECGEEVGKVSG